MLSAVFPWIRVEENDVIELFGVGWPLIFKFQF